MSSQPNELDGARQKRLEELQRLMAGQQSSQDDEAEQIAALESFVKSKLTNEALARYTNLKLAYPDKAMRLLGLLVQAVRQYRIERIDDAQLKDLLQRMAPEKKEFKFTRK